MTPLKSIILKYERIALDARLIGSLAVAFADPLRRRDGAHFGHADEFKRGFANTEPFFSAIVATVYIESSPWIAHYSVAADIFDALMALKYRPKTAEGSHIIRNIGYLKNRGLKKPP